ncbi:MAG: DNA gyrase inhibitor YacG [Burkholderiaceae bacterium]|nr:DNA gyrase inhibitor YacG [Burkholderiaceae bacterium]
MKVKCPTCGSQVAWTESNAFRPFCSERCRTIDLGAWASERHRIAGEALDAPSDAGTPTSGEAGDRKG